MSIRSPRSPKAQTNSTRGFTLIELLVAVGVASGAILTLIALIPFGYTQLQESTQRTAEARILQTISSDYQLKNWSVIEDQDNAGADIDYHFDLTGAPVAPGDPESHWISRVSIKPPPTLPGETIVSPYARTLQVLLTEIPDPAVGFASDNLHVKRVIHLSKSDK